MDLDGDGRRDVLSGSRPGEVYLFAGSKDGGFARGVAIRDATGAVLRAGRSSVVHVVDWEGDGDLDLVLGSCEGRVWLVRNASGDRRLRLGKPARLAAAGKAIHVPGRDSAPVVVDWDGDGRHDLLLGCGDGRVLFFRNVVREGEPSLAEPVTLVKPTTGKDEDRPGQCVKLAVADWNGDGRLDLLVGDRFRERVPRPELTRDQVAYRDALRRRREELRGQLAATIREHQPELEGRARAELWVEPETPLPELPSETRREIRRRTLELQQEQPGYREVQDGIRRVSRELLDLEGGKVEHGRVWLFTRTAATPPDRR